MAESESSKIEPNLSSDSDIFFEQWLNYLRSKHANRSLSVKEIAQRIATRLPHIDLDSEVLLMVQFALEVNFKLGAKVAGIVKEELQPETVNLVNQLDISQAFKMRLLGMTGSKCAIDLLLTGLSDRDPVVRRSAARALVKISSDNDVSKLCLLLNSDISEVRGWAAWVLAKIGTELVISGLVQSLYHKVGHVREWAIWALGKIGKSYSILAFYALLKALNHYDAEVRWRAVFILGEMAIDDGFTNPEMILSHLVQCLNDRNSSVRSEVIAALGKMGDRSVISALVKKLNDPEIVVIKTATEALGKIGGDLATSALLKSLNHHDDNVRSSAILGLAKIGTEVSKDAIAAALLEDKDYMVQAKAAETLGKLRFIDSISSLVIALNHPEYYVRWQVVDSLGKIGGDAAIEGLMTALEDSMSPVRKKAIKALAEIRSKAAIQALKNAKGDAYAQDVRDEATAALTKLKHLAKNPQTFYRHRATNSSHPLLPKMAIVSYAQACEELRDPNSRQFIKSIISIGRPIIPPPPGFFQVPNRLRLEFNDIEAPVNDPESILPNFADIQKILEFVPKIAQTKGYFLVHCQAGISRSSAVALTVCAALLGPGKEREAMDYVLEVKSRISPNLWIVELADEALERNGKLVEVAQKY